MADSCSSSTGEVHAILLGALAVLQQIDNEEKKEKLKKRNKMVDSLKDCAALAVRRMSCSDEGNGSGGPHITFANFIRMDTQQFEYLLRR